MALVVVVAMVAAILGFLPPNAPAADARPGPDGSYDESSPWDYSPNPQHDDGSHSAFTSQPFDEDPSNDAYLNPHTIGLIQRNAIRRDDASLEFINLREEAPPVVRISGPAGARAEYRPQGTQGRPLIAVSCATLTLACPAPGGYSISLSWTISVQERACVEENNTDQTFVCPRRTIEGSAVRTYTGPREPVPPTTTTTTTPKKPIAGFSWALSDTTARQVDFTNTSTSPDSRPLKYEWTFEAGKTSTERNPSHVFAAPGTYTVTLKVTDDQNRSNTFASQVVIPGGLVVNSTGDGAAVDVAAKGCDTGGVVANAPECTLRAAIETANEQGGGEITFAIDGTGVPVISPATLLPNLLTSITVDGTSQPGGFVKIAGGGGNVALTLAGGTSRVTGMVIDQLPAGIVMSGGTGHRIEGNRFGTDDRLLPFAVASFGGTGAAPGVDGIVIENNELVCTTCVRLIGGTGARVQGNTFGVEQNGRTETMAVDLAVWLSEAQGQVSGNTISANRLGVLIEGPGAGGSTIGDNYIGVGRGGENLNGPAVALRVDAAPAVTLSNNVLAAYGEGAVQVTGSDQLAGSDPLPPTEEREGGPVTGGGTVIKGNTIGLKADQRSLPRSGPAIDGVFVWAGAANVRIESNVIANQRRAGIVLRDGSGHRVVGNTLGTDPSGGAELRQAFGIQLEDTTDVVIGASGASNLIRSTEGGILVSGVASGTQVVGNDIARAGLGISIEGPGAGEDTTAALADTAVNGNTIKTSTSGVALSGRVVRSVIRDNTTTGGNAGVLVTEGVDGTEITANTILGADRGVLNAGSRSTITANLIGVDRSGTVSGSSLAGIAVNSDSDVEDNVVVGSGNFGIVVGSDVVGRLKGNRIYDTTGVPIRNESGPDTPTITAALRTSTGGTDRTVLIVTGLSGGGGTVEVFANDDCADAEARYVLELTAPVRPGRDYVVIPVIGRGNRDAFTVTYTNAADGTSELSNCEGRSTYPDTDGDGAYDPIEDLADAAGDPRRAVVVADNGDLLLVEAADGRLANVAAVDDPAPGNHPGGFTLPHGAVNFEVRDLEPGATTNVALLTLDGRSPILGDSYWKYGPAAPGVTPSWYRFDPDEATDTGATLETLDVPGVGFTRVWNLTLTDGGRGDDDGFANGTITDPSGPGIGGTTPPTATAPPAVPDDGSPTAPTEPDGSATPDASGATDGGTNVGAIDRPGRGNPAARAVSPSGRLPFTGSETGPALAVGLFLTIAGLGAALAARRQRHARPAPPT